MPYRREGSRVWYAKFRTAGGRQVRRSTGTTDRAAAAVIEADWKAQAWRQKYLGESEAHLWDEGAEAYLDSLSDDTRATWAVRALQPHFSGKVLEQLTPEDITSYKAARQKAGVSDGTLIREMGVLSRILAYCRSELGWKDIPDVTRGRAPKAPPGRLRWLSVDEYHALVAAAKAQKRAPYLKDFIELAVATGMRKGEILGLEWRRVDLDRRLVYLEPEHTKTRTRASVPLNEVAVTVLKRRQARRRYVFQRGRRPIGDIKKGFQAAREAAGLDDVRIHDLRHTCAAWLVQSGVPLRVVAEVLRHKDIRMTMRYSHLAPEDTREAVDRIAVYQTVYQGVQKMAENG